MSEKCLKNSDIYQTLVYFNLKTIYTVSLHGLKSTKFQPDLVCKVQEDLVKTERVVLMA